MASAASTIADRQSPSPSPKSPVKATTQGSDDMDTSNQELAAPTSPRESLVAKDDAATIAAGEELKQTTISDKTLPAEVHSTMPQSAQPLVGDESMKQPGKSTTPEPSTTDDHDEVMRERITSPKKKRGRDLDEEGRDVESPSTTGTSVDGHANANRTIRSGPEKKRPRDASVDSPKTGTTKAADGKDPVHQSPSHSSDSESKRSRPNSPKVFGSNIASSQSQTAASAFKNSAFGDLAKSSVSPFGTTGASKPSVFGTGSGSFGSGAFGSASSNSSTTTTTETKPASGLPFGGGSATTGFGGSKTTSVFASPFGNGFVGGTGPKLSSFAAPSSAPPPVKPAKAFGAPESDEDQDSGEDDSDGDIDSNDEAGKASPEDKKKIKPTKIEDGEAGEATLLQIRARLYAIESKDAGWKERGVGTLKVNVPKACASYDSLGAPVPRSFDATALDSEDEEAGPRAPRLIMRQENTHRVILNTIILREMEFKDKPAASGAQFMFTGLGPDNKPVNLLLKMSENNAKVFRAEIDAIKNELKANSTP